MGMILGAILGTMQCDCLKPLLVDDDFCGRPDKCDPLYIFQDKMQFQIFKKIFY
jgi:hypothetical protein